ncbi:unnamed protein product [Paramecium octaurelia]|uniref:Uncharacterized protein n=1 Tax=Paramecium octaurelia TaxID=43137 RepID=A0A8S1YAC8_PAROT|nr:unnamed protein product [Paramecium octaurelia]
MFKEGDLDQTQIDHNSLESLVKKNSKQMNQIFLKFQLSSKGVIAKLNISFKNSRKLRLNYEYINQKSKSQSKNNKVRALLQNIGGFSNSQYYRRQIKQIDSIPEIAIGTSL